MRGDSFGCTRRIFDFLIFSRKKMSFSKIVSSKIRLIIREIPGKPNVNPVFPPNFLPFLKRFATPDKLLGRLHGSLPPQAPWTGAV